MSPWTFQHAAILHLDPISCWGERWCVGLWMLKSKRHLGCRLDNQRGQMALDLFLKGRLNREPQMRLLKELGPCMNMGLKCGDCFRSAILPWLDLKWHQSLGELTVAKHLEQRIEDILRGRPIELNAFFHQRFFPLLSKGQLLSVGPQGLSLF